LPNQVAESQEFAKLAEVEMVRICVCSVNCPLVTAARFGYRPAPSGVRICTKSNRSIWVRISPIVLRAAYGAVCAIVVLASDVSRYRFAEQLVRWLVSRRDETDISSEFGVRDATAMLPIRFLISRPEKLKSYGRLSPAKTITGSPVHSAYSQRLPVTIYSPYWASSASIRSSARSSQPRSSFIAPATASWSTAYAVTNAGAVHGRDLRDLSHGRDAIKPCRQRGAHERDRGGR
jgi:hypothetical protein